jgi:hypothetical protein
MNPALSAERYQRDLPLVSGLEPDRRAGWDVEPVAERGFPVEFESTVDLEDVEMGPDLDRSVTRVPHRELALRTAGIYFDGTRCEDIAPDRRAHVDRSWIGE